MENLEKKKIDRRHFLTGSLILAAGTLAGCGATKAATTATSNSVDTTKLPYPYKALDVEAVRKLGYENYYKGECCYGAASALIVNIQKTLGSGTPWDNFPMDIFKWGAGGGLGWGTLCGAINGSMYVMQMVAGDKEKVTPIGNELIGWYTENPFPSNKCDAFAKVKNQPTSVSKSPLCHISVSDWCKVANAKVSSDERKDRCAKVTGDTAARAAEIMNAWIDNKFAAAYKVNTEFTGCLSCHRGSSSLKDNEQGLMDCTICHTDKLQGHPGN